MTVADTPGSPPKPEEARQAEPQAAVPKAVEPPAAMPAAPQPPWGPRRLGLPDVQPPRSDYDIPLRVPPSGRVVGAPIRDDEVIPIAEKDHINKLIDRYQNVSGACYSFYRRAPSTLPGTTHAIDDYQGSVAARQFSCYEDIHDYVMNTYGGNVWEVRVRAPGPTGRIGYVKDGSFPMNIDAPPIPRATKPGEAPAPPPGPDPGAILDRAADMFERSVKLAHDATGKDTSGDVAWQRHAQFLQDRLNAREQEISDLRRDVDKKIEKVTTEGGPSTRLLELMLPQSKDAALAAQKEAATIQDRMLDRAADEKRELIKSFTEQIKALEKQLEDQREDLLKDKENEVGRLNLLLTMEKNAAQSYKDSSERLYEARLENVRGEYKARIQGLENQIAALDRKTGDLERENSRLRDERLAEAMRRPSASEEIKTALGLAALVQGDGSDAKDKWEKILEAADKHGIIRGAGRLGDKIVDALKSTQQTNEVRVPPGTPVFRAGYDAFGQPIMPPVPVVQQPAAPAPAPVPPVIQHTEPQAPRAEERRRQSAARPPVVDVRAPDLAQPVPQPPAEQPLPAEMTEEEAREQVAALEQAMDEDMDPMDLAREIAAHYDARKLSKFVEGGVDAIQRDIERISPDSPLLSGRGSEWLGRLVAAAATILKGKT